METTVTGTQWNRCNAIHIQNTYGQKPQVTMQEEQITLIGDQQFQRSTGGFSIEFDPSSVIPLLNPADGTSLGQTMTQGQIHVALWSLYMAEVAKRAAQTAPV
jgi:hypothetical protein